MIGFVLRILEEKLNSLDTTHWSAYDRKILNDIVEILTPFETATHCFQGDKVMTSSMILSCVCVLKATIESLRQIYSSKFVLALSSSRQKVISLQGI